MSTASSKPMRWFAPPPALTAYFAGRAAGDGFAAAHDVCTVFGDLGNGTSGGGGNAAQVREVVERGAFGGEQRAGVAFDGSQCLTCADGLPVLDFGLEADGRIHRLKGEARQVHTGDNTVFAADEEKFGGFVGRDDGGGRNVAAPAQVFAQGLFHHRAQQGVGQGKEGFSDGMGFPLLKRLMLHRWGKTSFDAV